MSNKIFAAIIVATVAIMLGVPGAHAQLTLTDENDANCAGCAGIKTTTPAVELHVLQGGTPASPSGLNSKTGFLVQNTSDPTSGSIMTIMAGSSGNSQLFFGDTDAESAGRVTYSHASDTMRFFSGGAERFRMDASGNVGFNTTTLNHPLSVGDWESGVKGNGAHVTAGGNWTNGSSRKFKEDITSLGASEAFSALNGLNPVRFRYTLEPDEEYVGFIAEDVPELVATSSRKYLSPMDIVAVLTKVVQEQQATIDELNARVAALEQE
jgi:hypothetical protein